MPTLWTLREISDLVQGQYLPSDGVGTRIISRIVTLTGPSGPGDLYIPVRKTNFDAQQTEALLALRKNVSAVIVDSKTKLPDDLPVVRVSNIHQALRTLARVARDRYAGTIIGVTGSVGKTTTKDMLATMLSRLGETNASEENLNLRHSTLATVASLAPSAPFSVLELGMIAPGSIAPLAAVVRPHIGVITNIGVSHATHHPDLDSIFSTKMALFDHLQAGGSAVLSSGSQRFADMREHLAAHPKVSRIISCGELEDDDVRLLQARHYPARSEVVVRAGGKEVAYTIAQPGEPFVRNSLLAIGVLMALDVPMEAVATLSSYVPTGRRLERLRVAPPVGPLELIDDAYNAAPDSVAALLGLLRNRQGARRRVLIFGDMLELGPRATDYHLALAPDILASGIDLFIAVGDNANRLAAELDGKLSVVGFDSASECAAQINTLLKPFDLVAVKGSNGMKLISVVQAIAGKTRRSPRQGMDWSIESEPFASRH